jgi:transposase
MSAGGVMEIELSGGQRLRVDRHVDAEALRRVLAVLGR